MPAKKANNKQIIKSVDSDGKKIEVAVLRPDAKVSREAQKVYNRFFRDALESGALLRQKLDGYMTEQGLWNDDKQKEYDKLTSAIINDEKKIKAVWESQYSLDDIIAPDKFKSYQELDARFKTVIGSHTADYSETIEEEVAEPVTAAAAGATTFESESSEPNDSETMDYFKKLADQ